MLNATLLIHILEEIMKLSSKKMEKYKLGVYNMRVVGFEMCVFADDIVFKAENKRNLEEYLKTKPNLS